MREEKQDGRSVYNPNRLLDTLMQRLKLQSDGALSLKLKVAKNVITSIRNGSLPVAASMLLWMRDATGMSVDELRMLMGDRRKKCRLAYARIRQR
ncbi:MAG: hypothetical protein JWQ23_2975 [Herminiimonas sp.]|jgi:hypothetical protein|nr:hypothetical protein [Herminiimonas sp.]